MAEAAAARTIRIWKDRLAEELYKISGGADSGLRPDDFTVVGGEYLIRGNPVSKSEWQNGKAEAELADEGDEKRVQSDWEKQIRQAIAEHDNYVEAVKGQNLEDAPEDIKKTGPGTEGKPIEIGLRQFMAALGGQESSGGYRPSWATAPITQGFGPTDEPLDAGYDGHPHFNKGYDYGIPVGTPIDATTGGEVISVGDSGDGWGISVKVRDDNGFTHNYGHLDSTAVNVGDRIGAGILVGKSGNTGKSTGPHLSYDVWDKDGRFVDPKRWIDGGGYDVVNSDSGAAGRYQIMPENWPSWAAEAGLPPDAPQNAQNQEIVAAYKLQQYYDQYQNWDDVAALWYSGRDVATLKAQGKWDTKNYTNGQEYPSVAEYVNSVVGKAADIGKMQEVGYLGPDGKTWITGPSSGSGSSGSKSTYDPVKAKQDKEDREYELFQRALGLEQDRAGEMDRRYGDISKRMSDYIGAAKGSNDLLADIAAALGNEARLVEMNQGIQDDAMGTAAQINAAVQAGKLGYRDSLAGSIWSNSLSPIQKELEKVRAALQTAPEGFADSILATIPKTVPLPYEITDALNLPGYEGEYWAPQKRYSAGTVPRYANGTTPGISWHDEPYVALYNQGKYVPSSILARLRAAGAIDGGGSQLPGTSTGGTTVPDQVVPSNSNATYRPGYVPRNSTLPPDLRVTDNGEWLDAAVSKAAMMISAGNAAFAAAWGLGDLAPYAGMPASAFDGGLIQMIRSAVLANKDSPESAALFGSFPNVETVWVPDPNAPPTKATPGGGGGGGGQGFQNPSGAQYGGVYQGAMDPYDSARIALEKEQLALQREVAKAQMELDRDRFALEQIQDTRSAEYQAAQIRWNDAKAALDEKNFLLQQSAAALQERIFEDSIRRYEIETGMAREQLDMSKIRQEADLAYQAKQLELQVEAGLLSREEYEEKKRQFELTFNYQKEKDQKALDIERAKTTVEYLSNPKDAVRSQFWYASQADPVGTAYDLFTGENRGQKTWTEAYNEDANLFMEAMKPVKQMAYGSDSFVRDLAAILGDSKKSNRATGNEEVIINPTGAPFMVLSNDMSRALGFVPTKGKPFGSHVREGRAS